MESVNEDIDINGCRKREINKSIRYGVRSKNNGLNR